MAKINSGKEFKESIKELDVIFDKIAEDAQILAILSLVECKHGRIECANYLIDVVHEEGGYDLSFLIKWFERYGKLKWSNKKKRLVYSDSGRWFSDGKISLWLKPSESRYVNIKSFIREHGMDKDLKDQIHMYLKRNPDNHSEFGRMGVPASKVRWGDYKIKAKRK